ncbi:hypothetical protein C3747_207g84 [Trypanosoma cruzi]|uniref:HIT-type domain-containing protein n=2 Tax=Trypanosoma cruzi TaxID=5693 RepID=Q4DC88_TRYCC|nr:hypothetical protein, conserved [Trypanosoma cruzi]EAN90130.1 hypothetical protein, conserved [Trypanosoma cruzi]PWV00440.1 hypothetical protein C3747_207g84 [Trypanosoma cruzi]RNC41074.1 hypothetical protein TcCL_NonESM09382 [Trypanosoma cruzi]|eukprot:XP_811981.1 hypothetical protein [Trypanosoma cruzi strain CL Brener]
MHGSEVELLDAELDDTSGEEMRSLSSAADADLEWIPEENEADESQLIHEDYYAEGEENEEDEGPHFMASALSKAFARDLVNQKLQQQEGENTGLGSPCTAEQEAVEGKVKKAKICCICSDAAVYTCPGCGARTCSNVCVQMHKKEFQCKGERDIAKKVSLSEFTDGQLQRDFHFLEDVSRIISNCRRGFSKFWRYTFRALPPPLHALREAAKKRGVVCQITSEGMTKRNENTSRFDRRTETITWRCQFNFHDPDFTVVTDWGSERHRLGDIVAFCWSTNPPLPCFHINRRYNRASRWIGTAEHNEEVVGEEGRQEPMTEEGEGETRVENVATSSRVFLDNKAHCQEAWSPCQVSITPLSPAEARNEKAVAAFLEMEPVIILSRAERLGMRQKYFRMSPSCTLNEALRTLFFINEFPVFDVIHVSALEAYPLVTEADKEFIRESFRAAPRPARPECRPRPTKADLSPEEAARFAKVPCRMFLAGSCKLAEGACPYWHCAYNEVPACRNFVKFSICERGSSCIFRHDIAAVTAARKRMREERKHPCERRSKRRYE